MSIPGGKAVRQGLQQQVRLKNDTQSAKYTDASYTSPEDQSPRLHKRVSFIVRAFKERHKSINAIKHKAYLRHF